MIRKLFVALAIVLAMAGCDPMYENNKPAAQPTPEPFKTVLVLEAVGNTQTAINTIDYGYTINGIDESFHVEVMQTQTWKLDLQLVEPEQVWLEVYATGRVNCGIKLYYGFLDIQSDVNGNCTANYDINSKNVGWYDD